MANAVKYCTCPNVISNLRENSYRECVCKKCTRLIMRITLINRFWNRFRRHPMYVTYVF